MATFEQNIQIIRSTGIYGTDIREAIAEALEQTGSQTEAKVITAEGHINSVVADSVEAISDLASSMEQDIDHQIDAISERVDLRNLYMSTTPIPDTKDDYLLTFTNPT